MEIRKILLLTDLSDESASLLTYGLHVAQALNAEVWVQHVYYIPPDLAGEVFMPTSALERYEKQVRKKFEKLKESMIAGTAQEPHFVVSHGDLVIRANQLVDQKAIDLVVVGNRGGGLAANILGSHTLKVIYHIRRPVLTVPRQLVFQPFHRIAFAADWQQTSLILIRQLTDVARMFKAHLDIIHVSDRHDKPGEEVVKEHFDLREIPHTFYFIWARDIEEGLQKHIEEHHNDLVVLIPHRHAFFDRLFQKSVTRQMVYHSHIPLLTLRE